MKEFMSHGSMSRMTRMNQEYRCLAVPFLPSFPSLRLLSYLNVFINTHTHTHTHTHTQRYTHARADTYKEAHNDTHEFSL